MSQVIGEFEEIVLSLVAAQNGNAYGLSITNTIKEELERPVTMSSVHTALYRLEEKGLVESSIGGTSAKRGGRSKRIFTITSSGKSTLKHSREMRNKLWDMIPKPILGDM